MSSKIVAYRIKKLRRSFGYTQCQAAKLLGVTPTQLMEWEKGKRMPTAKFLFRLEALYQTLIGCMYYEERQEAIQVIEENKKKYSEPVTKVIKGKPP